MPIVRKTNKAAGPRMSDAAVQAKTGKIWKEWFAILDKAGAKKMSHQEITKYLQDDYEVGPWWTQMVAVTYEQQRGLREKHQKPNGYEISVSRTINAPTSKIFKALSNETARANWLGQDGLGVRKAVPNKSLRMTWDDGGTIVAVALMSKAAEKTQVVFQHSKLSDDKAAARMKLFWSKALDRLQDSIESGKRPSGK